MEESRLIILFAYRKCKKVREIKKNAHAGQTNSNENRYDFNTTWNEWQFRERIFLLFEQYTRFKTMFNFIKHEWHEVECLTFKVFKFFFSTFSSSVFILNWKLWLFFFIFELSIQKVLVFSCKVNITFPLECWFGFVMSTMYKGIIE